MGYDMLIRIPIHKFVMVWTLIMYQKISKLPLVVPLYIILFVLKLQKKVHYEILKCAGCRQTDVQCNDLSIRKEHKRPVRQRRCKSKENKWTQKQTHKKENFLLLASVSAFTCFLYTLAFALASLVRTGPLENHITLGICTFY